MKDPAPAHPVRRSLLIFAGALALRIVYGLWIRETACLDINLDPTSDMEAFHRWALSILNGDWLGRRDFHPFHPWQTAVAAREQWEGWYGHVFHQEPFYPYLVALIYLVAPPHPGSMILFQLVWGAAGCAFTYAAARRIGPEPAALAAGILSALYGPYLYYESLVLRDSFMIALNALILWVLLEARSRTGVKAWRWWGGGGLLAGVAYITKATILPFILLFLGWTVWERRRLAAAPRFRPSLLLAAGFCLAMSPVVIRNLAVGAPPLKITTRGAIEFINGNNPWHQGIGWFEGDYERVSSYAREILARSQGRLLPTAAAVVSGWSSDPAGLIWLQVVKTGYFFAPFEMPNNASYSYFRMNSPLLRYVTLSFYWISPLALLGLIGSWRRRRELVPVYLFLASGITTTVLFYVIARFRAPLMPAILILSGLGLSSILSHSRVRPWRRLGVDAVVILAVLLVNSATNYPDRDLVRPQDFWISIQGYQARGRADFALLEAERAREIFPSVPQFHRAAGMIYLGEGRRREALAALKQALALDPSDVEARREVRRIERESP